MSALYTIFQGMLEGLLAFFPISTDGHLIVVDHLTKEITKEGSLIPYYLALFRFGTIVSIAVVYRKFILNIFIEFFRILASIFQGKFSLRKMSPERTMVFMIPISLIPMIFLSFTKGYTEAILNDGNIIVEGCIFLAFGILLYIADSRYPGQKELSKMHIGDPILMGAVQTAQYAVSMPGVGPNVSIMLIRGYSETSIAAFPLVISIPAMLITNIGKFKEVSGLPVRFGIEPPLWVILAGLAVAVHFGVFSIKLLQWMISDDHLHFFAKYNAIIGGLILVIGLIEHVLKMSFYDLYAQIISFFV